MSKTSNEFVLHLNIYEIDYHYENQKKNEIISTIAESYYKLNHSKLKFAFIDKDYLREYVTSKGQKYYDTTYTLMDNDHCYIENIIKNEKQTKKEEDEKEEKQNSKTKENDNEDEKIKKKKLGENIIKEGETENFDINLDIEQNPFKKALVGGAVAYGTGIIATWGSIATCIILDSVSTAAVAGYIGGCLLSGMGFVVAIPSLLGFGIYKLYNMNKEKRRKEFFDSFKLDKMQVEREVQLYVISKIDNYFNRYISDKDIETKNLIEEFEKNINSIVDIYIKIDEERIYSCPQKNVMHKLNEDNSIVLQNIPKIRKELMQKILGLNDQVVLNIFNEGIPLFKEFIKNFGPQRIDTKIEKEIDGKYIKRIISIMTKLLNNMKTGFDKFDTAHFLKSFDSYLTKKYEDKKKLDDKTESYFISDINDFIITPIGDMSKNYGVLSLYFKFTMIIQNIAIEKKEANYNKNKKKLLK